MKTWNRLTAARGDGGGGEWWKEGEETSQRTCMNDPCRWTTVQGLILGTGSELGRGGPRGKNWDNRNRINQNKKKISQNRAREMLLFLRH